MKAKKNLEAKVKKEVCFFTEKLKEQTVRSIYEGPEKYASINTTCYLRELQASCETIVEAVRFNCERLISIPEFTTPEVQFGTN